MGREGNGWSSKQQLFAEQHESGCPKGANYSHVQEISSCRLSRELALDEVEFVLNRVKIAAGLIDLSQRELALIWHAARCK
jgi:hypothetical protein